MGMRVIHIPTSTTVTNSYKFVSQGGHEPASEERLFTVMAALRFLYGQIVLVINRIIPIQGVHELKYFPLHSNGRFHFYSVFRDQISIHSFKSAFISNSCKGREVHRLSQGAVSSL